MNLKTNGNIYNQKVLPNGRTVNVWNLILYRQNFKSQNFIDQSDMFLLFKILKALRNFFQSRVGHRLPTLGKILCWELIFWDTYNTLTWPCLHALQKESLITILSYMENIHAIPSISYQKWQIIKRIKIHIMWLSESQYIKCKVMYSKKFNFESSVFRIQEKEKS